MTGRYSQEPVGGGSLRSWRSPVCCARSPAQLPPRRLDAERPVRKRPQYQRALTLGVQAYVYGLSPARHRPRVQDEHERQRVRWRRRRPGQPVQPRPPLRQPVGQDRRRARTTTRSTRSRGSTSRLAADRRCTCPSCSGRFVVFELVDPYTENFAEIGSVGRPPGDYAIVPPGWHGSLAAGCQATPIPVHDVSGSIGRTYVENAADTPNVVRIQNEYSLTPLSRWGKRYGPRRPKHVIRTSKQYTIPGTQPGEDPLAFFDALGEQLKQFPPPAAQTDRCSSGWRPSGSGQGCTRAQRPDRCRDAPRSRDAVAAGATRSPAMSGPTS